MNQLQCHWRSTVVALCAAAGFLLSAGQLFSETNCDSLETSDSATTAACVASEMHDSDKRINETYKRVMDSFGSNTASKDALRKQQRAWLKSRDKTCHLDNKEPNREKWIQQIVASLPTALCVVRYTKAREKELAALLAGTTKPPTEGKKYSDLENLSDFVFVPTSGKSNGKWYFETSVQLEPLINKVGNIQVTTGFASQEIFLAPYLLIRKSMLDRVRGKVITIGHAIDLDNGKFYFNHKGKWSAEPGSASGIDVKLGREYLPAVQSTEHWSDISCCVHVNLGAQPFVNAVPAGFKAYNALP